LHVAERTYFFEIFFFLRSEKEGCHAHPKHVEIHVR
jgi:hypothetical protein